MKPVIFSYKGPVYVDALIRSMDLFYPNHEQPTVIRFKNNPEGDKKLHTLHDIQSYDGIGSLINILEVEARLNSELMLLQDTSMFIRPFNTNNNNYIKRFRSDDSILIYYLGMDMDMYDAPPTNIFNFKNETNIFQYVNTLSATIFKSKDLLRYIDSMDDRILNSFSNILYESNHNTNRIIDNKRTVLNYDLYSYPSSYNDDFMEGKMIDYNEYIYFETPERCLPIEKLNMIWR